MARTIMLLTMALSLTAVLVAQPAGPLEFVIRTTKTPMAPLRGSETLMIARLIAEAAHVAMGFEKGAPLPPNAAPRNPQPFDGITVRAGLSLLVTLDPQYEWRDIDGVPVVRPLAAWNSPESELNRQLPPVQWNGITQSDAVDRITHLLYASAKARASTFGDRAFSVNFPGGTTIELLNAVAKAGGFFWWTERRPLATDAATTVFTLATFEGHGIVAVWPPNGGRVQQP